MDELVPYVDAHFPTRRRPGGRFDHGPLVGRRRRDEVRGRRTRACSAPPASSRARWTPPISYPVYPAVEPGACGCSTLDPRAARWRTARGATSSPSRSCGATTTPPTSPRTCEGIDLYLTSGDGNPGELDDEGASFDVVEWTTYQMNQGLEDRARRRGRAVHRPTSTAPARTRGRTGSATSSASSPGSTRGSASRWRRPRRSTSAPRAAASPPGAGASAPRRDTREFAYLDDVSKDGLTATGSGTLDVSRAALPAGPRAASARRQDGRLASRSTSGRATRRSRLRFGDGETGGLDHEAGGDRTCR